MAKTSHLVFFVVYLVFGLYLINYALNLIPLPLFSSTVNQVIFSIGGLLVLLGGINYLRLSRYKY